MSGETTGILLAVGTTVVWAISPLFMASVGRRIGSQNTNLLRALGAAVFLAGVVLPAYWLLVRGGAALVWPTWSQAMWLTISGTIGMVVGDACFYEALVLLGARRAVKLNTLAPVIAVLAGWVWLGERLDASSLVGAAMVIGAVVYATFANVAPESGESREPGAMSPAGVVCGVVSAACIGLGSVTGRQAFKVDGPLDPITATVVRVGFAAAVLWIWSVATGRAARTLSYLMVRDVRARLAVGTFLGPIVGMLGFVTSLKFAPAGLVSTIVAAAPLVIMPVVAWRYGVRVRAGVVVALVVAVVGVGLISWT